MRTAGARAEGAPCFIRAKFGSGIGGRVSSVD